jgi:hypothetical protein
MSAGDLRGFPFPSGACTIGRLTLALANTMLEFEPYSSPLPSSMPRPRRAVADHSGEKEARVKPDCVHLYPGVDPQTWYQVVQEGEYRDEMEGLWIQVNDWVTYVLAKHFDLQSRPPLH